MSDALHTLDIQSASRLLASGVVSSRELTKALIDRIAAVDPEIGAYLDLDTDAALAQADAADAARKAGQSGPLLGIPVGIKDVINVRGQSCTCASQILKGYRSPYDATSIARLREAGVVFLGRLNMDEFAMGSSNENSSYKTVHNPWDRSRVPGGSSGGSAAAVGGHLALAALGSDTGGSIRQPASFCGCVGFKPTYGRISRYGLTAFASSLDQIGPLTKSVYDSALLYAHMAGRDPRDATTVETPRFDPESIRRTDLKGLRLGLPKEYFIDGVEPDVRKAVDHAVRTCASLGAELVEVSLPMTPHAIAVYYVIATAEASANLARFDGIRYGHRAQTGDLLEVYEQSRAEGFGPEVKRRIILGTYVLSSGYYDAYYVRAQKVRTLIRRDFDQAFRSCDAILTPATPGVAFPLGAKSGDPLQMYLNDIFTVTANLAGICGLSVPCGFSTDGLPIGLQILGPALREDRILEVAYAYEQASPWRSRRPAL